jgi:hypothetical protein
VIEIVKHGDIDYIPPNFPLDVSAMVKKEDDVKDEDDNDVPGRPLKHVKKEKSALWTTQKKKERKPDPAQINKKIRQHDLGQKRVYRLKQTRLVQHDTLVGVNKPNSLAKFMVKHETVKTEK